MSFLLPQMFKSAFTVTTYITRRFYAKNILRRKPVRVFNVPKEDHLAPIRDDILSPQVRLADKVQDNSVGVLANKEELIVPSYEKLKKNDARFTKVLSVIKSRQLREHSGKILLEGKRLINDAVAAGVELKTIYFSQEKDLAAIKFKNQTNVEILKVMYRTLQLWSDLSTCPGIMGVFQRPTVENLQIRSEPTIPVTLLCDNIREPGNLGALIRNASAAGCEHILLLKGCVDPWETKVLRAGCGGHFRIPIINNIEWTHIANYISDNSKIFIADNAADISECVATSDYIDFNEGLEDEEEVVKYVTMNEHNQQVVIDETYSAPDQLENFKDIDLPCYLYSSIKYPKENIVLYVGGETHGLDARAVKLACDYGGRKIKIPIEHGMDSLNSSFAAAIILYEIKRQLTETYVTK